MKTGEFVAVGRKIVTGYVFFQLIATHAGAAIGPARELNALLILSSQNSKEMWTAVEEVIRQGGQCGHVFAPNVIIGFVPPAADTNLCGVSGIVNIHREHVDVDSLGTYGFSARCAAAAWNAWLDRDRAVATQRGKGDADEPTGDALDGPEPSASTRAGLTGTVASHVPNYDQTSEFLIGKVAVGIVLPESVGGTENWSTNRQLEVVSQIQRATQWWSENSYAPTNLSFVYDIHAGVPTIYEPIAMTSDSFTSWIPDIMKTLGCTNTPGDAFDNTRQYNNRIRTALGTDWGFTFFVVDAANDADSAFASGGSFSRAFTYRYYFVVEPYGRPEATSAHEMAHIFGARDEYLGASSPTATGGYLDITNSNHESGNPSPEMCIMRGQTVMAQSWTNHQVCRPTREMVGWRDSDGDGRNLYDPVDTAPQVVLSAGMQNPNTNLLPIVTGTLVDVPCPSPARPLTTINTITGAQWRVDGGGWQTATPADGALNLDSEDILFRPEVALPFGTHLFEARAFNSVGNISTSAQFSVTMTYTDADNDGLPDAWEQAIIDADPSDSIHTIWDVKPDDDFDHDGLCNRDEFLAGSGPINAVSVLKISRSAWSPQGFSLRWPSASGRSYDVLRTTDLKSGFTPCAQVINASPPENAWTNPPGAGTFFYQIKMRP